jgi:hypothetical protein
MQLPEMHRTPLEHVCLQIKLLKLSAAGHKCVFPVVECESSWLHCRHSSIADVLNLALQPPSVDTVKAAVDTLKVNLCRYPLSHLNACIGAACFDTEGRVSRGMMDRAHSRLRCVD